MRRGLVPAAGLAMLMAAWAALSKPTARSPLQATTAPGAEEQIRAKRERFNGAIVARDTAALAAIWTADVRVITSAGTRIEGRDTYRLRFAGYFADRPEYGYRRDPDRIVVYDPWGVAAEHGRWRARWRAADGPVDVGGEYIIQWVHSGTEWFVSAEMFAPPDHCTGGEYCATRP